MQWMYLLLSLLFYLIYFFSEFYEGKTFKYYKTEKIIAKVTIQIVIFKIVTKKE